MVLPFLVLNNFDLTEKLLHFFFRKIIRELATVLLFVAVNNFDLTRKIQNKLQSGEIRKIRKIHKIGEIRKIRENLSFLLFCTVLTTLIWRENFRFFSRKIALEFNFDLTRKKSK